MGDQVLAYDPHTKQTTVQTVQHIFINHDSDLVDVKLRTGTAPAAPDGAKPKPAAIGQHPSRAPPQGTTQRQSTQSLDETVHTTYKHPFLTVEQGWVEAGQLQPGVHVLSADGSVGVVEAVQMIPGAGTRYDLTVSNVHTFAVGLGQWVVHNCGSHNWKTFFGRNKRVFESEDEAKATWRTMYRARAKVKTWIEHDGTVFENREGYLPGRRYGYYREYTIAAPGAADRGVRRLVVGLNGEAYFSRSHYGTAGGRPFYGLL